MVQPLINLTSAIAAALARERETGRIQCVLQSPTSSSRFVVVAEDCPDANSPWNPEAIVWATGFADSDGLDPALLA